MDAHDLVGGVENVTPVARYRYFAGTSRGTAIDNAVTAWTIVPDGKDIYYLFTATNNDTVSIESNMEGVRFRIEDVLTSRVIYDSSNDDAAHLRRQDLSANPIERARGNTIGLINGRQYYCRVYRDSSFPELPLYSASSGAYAATGWTRLAIGSPVLQLGQQAFNSPTTEYDVPYDDFGAPWSYMGSALVPSTRYDGFISNFSFNRYGKQYSYFE